MISVAKTPTVPFAQTKCGGCVALCCRYFALEIDAPEEPDDFENLRWYLIHEDVNLFVEDGDWFLQIFRKCMWLDGNKCGNYENRPQICREYSDEECDFDSIDSDLTFRTVEELEAYRKRWVKDWEAKRERRRAAARKGARTRQRRARQAASRSRGRAAGGA